MEEDPNYFFKETAFLKLFLSFMNDKKKDEEQLEEILILNEERKIK